MKPYVVSSDITGVEFSDGRVATHVNRGDIIYVRRTMPEDATYGDSNGFVRLFDLVRAEDVSGVSGTGVVAEGACFGGGLCVLRWLTATASTAVYDFPEHVIAIHGHEGATRLRWHREEEKR